MLLILAIHTHVIAQKQNNQWRFGSGGGIDFNSTPPGFVSGALIATAEGSASVSDRITGALLFYTDGVTVWNANNVVMPNGTQLLGGTQTLLSSTTAAVIIPKPGSNNLFYIVTVDEQSSGNGVRYSVVDMTLNAGLGDIVAGQKNIFLFQTTSEKLEVVPASDGVSFWLLTHDEPGNSFYAFRVTASGISSTPVISTVGAIQSNGAGHMKINRQLNKLAIGVTFGSAIELFDFDNGTGVVSNPISWNHGLLNPLIYGLEFSPNGRVLYASNLDKLVQFDITQPTSAAIQSSAYQIPTGLSQPAALQLASDGRVYVNAGSVNSINCPNNLGASCNYQTNAIANQAGGGGYGLPKWVYYTTDTALLNVNAITYSDSCLGNATQFSIRNTAGIVSVAWNFGDPASGASNTATGFTTAHTFSQVGNYTIRAILSNACGFDTLFFNSLSIVNCNTPSITGFNIIGDTCDLDVNFTFQPVGTTNSSTLTWTFDDPNSGANTFISSPANPNAFHIFSAPGKYNVCLSFQEPGFPVNTICREVSIGQCCDGVISSTDTCLKSSIPFTILTRFPISGVTWDFGDPAGGITNTSALLTPSHLFSGTGTFNVRAIVEFSCGIDTLFKSITITECDSALNECKLHFPSAFTPNGDGLNDQIYPLTDCSFEDLEFQVFNRWGQVVYRTKSQIDKWDGRYKGADCATGVYLYLVKYRFPTKQKRIAYGTITLLR